MTDCSGAAGRESLSSGSFLPGTLTHHTHSHTLTHYTPCFCCLEHTDLSFPMLFIFPSCFHTQFSFCPRAALHLVSYCAFTLSEHHNSVSHVRDQMSFMSQGDELHSQQSCMRLVMPSGCHYSEMLWTYQKEARGKGCVGILDQPLACLVSSTIT